MKNQVVHVKKQAESQSPVLLVFLQEKGTGVGMKKIKYDLHACGDCKKVYTRNWGSIHENKDLVLTAVDFDQARNRPSTEIIKDCPGCRIEKSPELQKMFFA